MDIVVCLKQVPEVTDAELEITRDSTEIITEDLEYDINEWDNYAVEEAVRIKEAHGGKVTVITLGNEDSDDVLRQALAMGADEAIRVDDEGFEGSDARGIAKGIFHAMSDLSFDLLLSGAQSSDDGWGQVGLMLAEFLGLPYASLVVDIEIAEEKLIVKRELESNAQEKIELPLPSALTIQTGLNSPRYVSIMGIQRVRNIGIKETSLEQLDLSKTEIGQNGSSVELQSLSLPPVGEGAEMLTGAIEEIADQVAQIIRDRGGVV